MARCVASLLLVFALGAKAPLHGQETPVETALERAETWLAGAQNPDGSFGSLPELTPRDSALAVLALAGDPASDAAVQAGASFLEAVPEANTHFRSRRILALAAVGRGVETLSGSLFQFRNGGGFGAFGDHRSTLLDTALAVEALSLDQAGFLLELVELLDFLQLHQASDGGWGLTPDSPSAVYFSAEILRTLAALEQLSVGSGVLDGASAFLRSSQLGDGSFGSVLETAVAYRSLLRAGVSPAELPSGSPVPFLLAAQGADGSWDGDVFTTAQVVLALRLQRPNLVVAAVDAPASTSSGTPFAVTVTVRNAGAQEAGASRLEIRREGDGELLAEALVPALGPGEEADVSLQVDPTGSSGTLALVASADAGEEISELDEEDNAERVEITLQGGPDLALLTEDLIVEPASPEPGRGFELRISARNLGESEVPSFSYRVAPLVAGAPGEPLAQATAGPLAAGGGLLIPVPLSLPEGEHTLEVSLDPEGSVPEETETNNAMTVTFFVVDRNRPDLAVADADLLLTPPDPAPGDSVDVAVTVRNLGGLEASADLVLFENDPGDGGVELRRLPLTLAPGEGRSLTATVPLSLEAWAVTAVLDPDGAVSELDETNNRARRTFRDLPDLALGFDNFEILTASPLAGDPVEVRLTVRNAGTAEATGVAVAVDADGEPVFSELISSIPAAGNAGLRFTWTAVAGAQTLTATADPAEALVERSESNNRTAREVAVPRPSGPNLGVSGIDRAALAESAENLEIAGTVGVEIANDGDADVATPFELRLFEDRDGDGRRGPGDRSLGSAVVSDPLPAGATVTVAVDLEATLAFHRPLAWAAVDAGDVIPERREDDNRRPLFADCEAPPVVSSGVAEPVEEWFLPGLEVEVAPVVVQLSDDDGDGRIDSRDVPDVVFHTADAEGSAIVAVSGLDGSRVWTVRSTPDNPVLDRFGQVAAADLDGDGVVEIVAHRFDRRLVILEHTGEIRAVSDPVPGVGSRGMGGPAIGDLDGDGVPEIVYGRTVLSNDGRLLAQGTANQGQNWNFFGPFGVVLPPGTNSYPQSVIADIDLDGRNELVAGNAVYRLVHQADGIPALEVVWDAEVDDRLMVDGFAAVGNLDDDPEAEIVYVSSGQILGYHHDGSTFGRRQVMVPFSISRLPTFWGSAPTIADLDGDGRPEVLVGTATHLIAYNPGLSTKWSRRIVDDFGGIHGVTAFDLDGDGVREVFFFGDNLGRDTRKLFLLDGATGQTLHTRKIISKTAAEYTVIADVDGDGRAELVVPSNFGFGGDGSTQGLHVLGHPSYQGTRPIWNQYGYHVTNVLLDGTVPSPQVPPWQADNLFRGNRELPAPPRLLPNLTAGLPRVGAATADGVPVTVRVGNGGLEAVGAGVAVELFDRAALDADPAGAEPVATGVTTRALLPGRWQDVEVLWTAAGAAGVPAAAVVDRGGAVEECSGAEHRVADNRVDFELTETLLPDLAIAAGGVTAPSPVAAGQVVPVTVVVENLGTAVAAATTVRFWDGDPGEGSLLGDAELPALAPGEKTEAVLGWDTLGEAGVHLLHVEVDPEGVVTETDLDDNRGLVSVELTSPARPDLEPTGIGLEPASVSAGAPVSATVTVLNRGADLPDGFALALRVNGAEVERRILATPLGGGSSAMLEFALATGSLSGSVQVEAVADPAGEVGEENEANNTAAVTLEVTAAKLSVGVATDALAYPPGASVGIATSLDNRSSTTVEGRLVLGVVDALGQPVAPIFEGPLELPPGVTTLEHTWPSGTALPGGYSVLAELFDGAVRAAAASASFSVASRVELGATLFTDRDLYAPQQAVVFTGSLTNESLNTTLEDIQARISVTGPGGIEVFALERSLPSFFPGARVPLEGVWELRNPPAGTYHATLGVRDGGGLLLASASTSFRVAASDETGDGLVGRLVVRPERVGSGAPVQFDLELRNDGNGDMEDLVLRLDVLRLDDGSRVARRELPTPLARGAGRRVAFGLDSEELPSTELLVTLAGVLPGRVVRLDRAAFTVVPAVSVQEAAVAEGDSGTSTVEVEVTLSEPAVEEVTVPYSTADGTARAGSDYQATSGTLTFAPGEQRKTLPVTVFGDLEPESREIFLVTLGEPTGVVLGDPQAVVELRDEEGCASPELLVNAAAEGGTASDPVAGWSDPASLWRRSFAAPPPLEGLASFAAGGGDAGTPVALEQRVDLEPFAAVADGGGQRLRIEAFVWTGPAADGAADTARLVVEILAGDGTVLETRDGGSVTSPGTWSPRVEEIIAGAGARSLRLRLEARENGGDSTEVLFDRVSVRALGTPTLSLEGSEVLEGDPPATPFATVVATLSCALPSEVSADYSTADGTALAGADYTAQEGRLTFAAGETSATFQVPVLPDLLDEEDEDLTVGLSNLSGDPSAGSVVLLEPTGRVTLLDDDSPVTVSAVDTTVTEGDGVARIEVALSDPSGRTVSVDYAATGDTARAGEDFRAAGGTLVFAPGEEVQVVEIPLLDDGVHEAEEAFTVALSSPTGATLATPSVRVTVSDDDSLEARVADVHSLEGDAPGSVTFTVQLSVPSAVPASLDFSTADATALAGQDYLATAGSLSFPASDTPASATVEVPLVADLVREPTEVFRLVLSNPVGLVPADPEAVATVIDDDGILVSVGDVTVREGDPGDGAVALFPVTLQKASTVPVRVTFATADGTARAGADYRATQGVAEVPAGATRTEVAVPLIGDTTEEVVESFFLELSEPVEAEILDGRAEATLVDDDGWILNSAADDLSLPGCIVLTPRRDTRGSAWRKDTLELETSFDVTWRIFVGDDNGREPGLVYALQRQGPAALGTSASFTGFDGISPSVGVEVDTWRSVGGDPGYDHLGVGLNGSPNHDGHRPVPATRDFANLEDGSEHTLRVVWNAAARALDVHLDGDERLVMERDVVADVFGGDPTGVFQGFVSRVRNTHPFNVHYVCPTVSCAEPGAESQISVGDARVLEGDVGQVEAVFPVTLSCPAEHPVTVAYSTHDLVEDAPGSPAEEGVDYLESSGTLTFEPGTTAAHVRVPVLGDAIPEPTETFALALAEPAGAALRYDRGVGTILSDEVVLSVTGEVVEGTGSATFSNPLRLALGSPALEPLRIDYSLTGGSAVAGEDFHERSGRFTFQPGQSVREVVLPVIADGVADGDETVLLTVESSGLEPPEQTFVVTLADDDCAGPNLLVNGGNEEALVNGEIAGWTEVVSERWIRSDGRNSFLGPFEGSFNFYTTEDFADLGELRQDVDVSPFAADIDAGSREFVVSGHMRSRSFGGAAVDRARILVEYRDGDGRVLDVLDSNSLNVFQYWRHVAERRTLPPGTRTVRVRLISSREEGFSLDGYYDSLQLRPLGFANLSIGDAEVSEGATGTVDAVFPVRLQCAEGPVRVDYLTADGTATGGTDFTPQVGTLSFDADEGEKILAVPVHGDVVEEGDETFTVELVHPVGAFVERSTGVGTILDDESILSIADASVVEGDQGLREALFTVQLEPPLPLEATVDYTAVPGSATAGEDFEPLSGTLRIPAGGSSATLAVPVVGDTEIEDDETFTVELSNPNNALLGNAAAVGTVIDDDNVLKVADSRVTEGDEGTRDLVFDLELSQPPSVEVRVDWATVAATADEGIDYEPRSGTAVFPPGQPGRRVVVPVIGDLEVEPGETLFLALSNPVGTRVLQEDPRGVIVDDDDCPSPNLLGNPGAEEPPVDGELPFWTEVEGTLRRNSSRELDGFFAFAAAASHRMEAFQEVNVSAFADFIDRGVQRFAAEGQVFSRNESDGIDRGGIRLEFLAADGTLLDTLELGSATPADRWRQLATLGTAPPGTRTLRYRLVAEGLPGDRAHVFFDRLELRSLGTPMVLLGDVVVREDDGLAPFPIELICAHDEAVTVDLATADRSAVAGSDYRGAEGTITLPAGSTGATFEVEVLDDEIDEPAESFDLSVLSASLPVARASARGTLLDEEEAPTLAKTGSITSEGSGEALRFSLELATPSAFLARVDYATADGSARAGEDYLPAEGTVVFQPGETSAVVEVPLIDDGDAEPHESVLLQLTSPLGIGAVEKRSEGLILDDDGLAGAAGCSGPELVTGGGGETVDERGRPVGWSAVGEPWSRGVAPPEPFAGGAFLAPPAAAEAELVQVVDLAPFAEVLDTGGQAFVLQAWLQGVAGGADSGRLVAEWLGQDGAVLETFDSGEVVATDGWKPLEDVRPAPVGARSLRLRLVARRAADDGPLQAFFDGVSLRSSGTQVVSVAGAALPEGDGGSTEHLVVARLACADTEPVTVDFRTEERSATAGSDFIATSGSLTFEPGELVRLLPVRIVGDRLFDPGEELAVVLEVVRGGGRGAVAAAPAPVAILDDDPDVSPVTVTPPVDLALAEGETVSQAFQVTVPPGATAPEVDVYFVADNTSSMGSWLNIAKQRSRDLIGTLRTELPQVSWSFGVGRYGDFPSHDPWFFHQLSLSADTEAAVAAIDGWSTLGFGTDFAEGSFFALDRIASDADPAGGTIGWRPGAEHILVWFGDAAGNTPVCQALTGFDFDITEELIAAKLRAAGILPIAVSTPTGLDDDPVRTGGGYRSFCPIGGSPGQATRIAAATGGAHVFAPSTDQLIQTVLDAIRDEVEQIGELTLRPVGDSAPFVSSITPGSVGPLDDDRLHELSFTAELLGVVPCTDAIQVFEGTVEVRLDRAPAAETPLTVRVPTCAGSARAELTVGDATVTEGGPGDGVEAVFEVRLSEAIGREVRVEVSTVDVSAEAGLDYEAVSTTLIFPPGEVVRTVAVPVLGDLDPEEDEDFRLLLSNPVGAAVADGEGTGTILDDDGAPELRATKTDALHADADGDGVPSPGDTLRYTVTVASTGNAPVTGVAFKDLIPRNTTVVAGSVTTTLGAVLTEDPVEVDLGTLAAAEAATVTFDVVLDLPFPTGVADVSNQGTVTSDQLPALLTDDPDVGGDADPTVTMVTAAPRLVAEKVDALAEDADGDGEPSPGDVIAYTVTLRNLGNTAATGVRLLDAIPEQATLVAGSVETSAGTVLGQDPVEVEIGELAVSDGEVTGDAVTEAGSGEVTVTFRVRVANPIPVGVDEISNQATVRADGLEDLLTDDPESGGEADATVTPITAAPVLTVEKTDVLFSDGGAPDGGGDGVASPGDELLYRIDIANSGNTGATEVRWTDSIPVHTTLVPGTVQVSRGTVLSEDPLEADLGLLAAGASETLSFRVRIDDPFPFEVTEVSNRATATSAELEPVPSDDPQTPEGDPDATATPVFIVPQVSIDDVTVTEGDPPTGTDTAASEAVFTVTLSEPGNRPVKVHFETADAAAGSPALAGLDHEATAGELIFEPGETSLVIAVPVFGDLLDEPDESFAVALTRVEGGQVVDALGLGTILDDDPPPQVSVAGATVPEGDAGAVEAIFAVTLSSPSGFDVTVDYSTADGTARAGADYRASAGTLHIPAGSQTASITVPVLGDLLDEPDETFTVQLTRAGNAVLADAVATGSVLDDDEPPTLTVGDATVTEGDEGTAEALFPLTLSLESGREIRLDYATMAGSAEAGSDFLPVAGTLLLPPGSRSRNVSVPVVGDLVDELDETFLLQLSDPLHVVLADPVGEATILDDDEAQISIDDVTVEEGDEGTSEATFTVSLATVADREIRVDYATLEQATSQQAAAPGLAAEGADYLPVEGTLTFPAFTDRQSLAVPVVGDVLLEELEETFTVELSNPVETMITDGTGLGTILDDEVCPGPNLLSNPGAEERTLDGSILSWDLLEGDWRRHFGPPEPLEGRVTFGAGEAEISELVQDVDVGAYSEAIATGDQRFSFRASVRTFEEVPPDVVRVVVEYRDGANALVLDAYDSGEITSPFEWRELSDVRPAPPGTGWIRVRLLASRFAGTEIDGFADALELRSLRSPALSVGDVTVHEGGGLAFEGATELTDAIFPVRLSCPYEHEVTVSHATADGTAVAPEDYLAIGGSLAFPAGETEAAVPVPVVDDDVDEPHEVFFLDLSDPVSEGAVVLIDPRGEATILNDDFCARSHGFWKTHPEEWPVVWILMGGVEYEAEEMLAFLNAKGGDATLHLALQLVATKLNLARGSEPSIVPTVEASDAFLELHPPGSDPRGEARTEAERLKDLLDAYNNSCKEGDDGGGGGGGKPGGEDDKPETGGDGDDEDDGGPGGAPGGDKGGGKGGKP